MTISTLTTPPATPSRDDPDNFRTEADAYVDWQATDFVPEMNTIVGQMNSATAQVTSDETSAAYSAQVASAAANYLGEWDALAATPITVPSSVSNNGATWLLLSNMADPTSEEPADGATYWLRIWVNAMVRVERTENTALAFSNHGNFIDITSGTFNQDIAAISTLPSGWYCVLRNSGTGLITIDPNGAELIDGAATVTLKRDETRIIQSNATNFKSILIQRESPLKLLQTITPSAAASVEFTDFIDTQYKSYIIVCDSCTGSGALVCTVGTGATPTWATGAADYAVADFGIKSSTATVQTNIDADRASINMGSVTTTALKITLLDPSSAQETILQYHISWYSGGVIESSYGAGTYMSSTPVTGVRLQATAITGAFYLYGVR